EDPLELLLLRRPRHARLRGAHLVEPRLPQRGRLVEGEFRVFARQRIGLPDLLQVAADDEPLAEGEVDDRQVLSLDEQELLALDLLAAVEPVDRRALDAALDRD